ncbi:MAG: DUF2071 domain-containing protein [Synoicihabitans sp.]
MFQRWDDLLFLHWAWDPAEIQASLPAGLTVDTYDGRAWMGIVPFWMNAVRPRGLPAVPWLSWFLELNLRTYVYDKNGDPGVWFYSLDCNQPIATVIARRFFGLNYVHARQSGQRPPSGDRREFHSQRRSTSGESHFRWKPAGDVHSATLDSLEFFLVERYRLFSYHRNQLFSGRVWHEPYQISSVNIDRAETALWVDQGRTAPNRAPDHAMTSTGVTVSIFPLQLLR